MSRHVTDLDLDAGGDRGLRGRRDGDRHRQAQLSRFQPASASRSGPAGAVLSSVRRGGRRQGRRAGRSATRQPGVGGIAAPVRIAWGMVWVSSSTWAPSPDCSIASAMPGRPADAVVGVGGDVVNQAVLGHPEDEALDVAPELADQGAGGDRGEHLLVVDQRLEDVGAAVEPGASLRVGEDQAVAVSLEGTEHAGKSLDRRLEGTLDQQPFASVQPEVVEHLESDVGDLGNRDLGARPDVDRDALLEEARPDGRDPVGDRLRVVLVAGADVGGGDHRRHSRRRRRPGSGRRLLRSWPARRRFRGGCGSGDRSSP